MPPENPKEENKKSETPQPVAPHKIVFNAPPHPTVTQSPDISASSHVTDTKKAPSFRSYNYDIQSTVKDKGASLAQIVMAEARKQEQMKQTPLDIAEENQSSSVIKFTLIAIGIVAILGGGALLAYTLLKTKPVEVIPTNLVFNQLIKTEKITPIELPDRYKISLQRLVKDATLANIPISTLVDLQLSDSGSNSQLTSKDLLEIFEANVPESLAISLRPEYALGIHSFEKNSPYIVLITNDYESAYTGMLDWEKTMLVDLGGIFFEPENLAKSTSTDTIDNINFKDKVIKNKDTRVIYDKDGKTAFLWSIINRNIIVITTNADTLEEIIKRMTTSNIVR